MKKTNLQKFATLFEGEEGEEGLNEFIIENFNNQDADKYELNGTLYYLFDESDVMEQLDEDFDIEVDELIDSLSYGSHSHLADIVRKAMTLDYNYKTVANDYDLLENYYFENMGDGLYVYTKK